MAKPGGCLPTTVCQHCHDHIALREWQRPKDGRMFKVCTPCLDFLSRPTAYGPDPAEPRNWDWIEEPLDASLTIHPIKKSNQEDKL